MASCRITYIQLSTDETKQIDNVLSEILSGGDSVDTLSFLDAASTLAHEIPRRVRQTFNTFRLHQTDEAICIRGNPIDESLIGPTPLFHREPGESERANIYEVLHILYASLLGEPFGWTTIQNGYIINDVMPVPDHRDLVASSGSSRLFDLHTEDAFHPFAGDYLGLMCLRNPDRVSTVLSTLSRDDLSDQTISILSEARFIVGANVAQEVPAVEQLSPVLFGNSAFPYMRLNFNVIRSAEGDLQAESALEELRAVLQRDLITIIFEAGDCWYIDNLRVAHGRKPHSPRFDGTDRWLKRLYITSSFRRSAPFRKTPWGRVLNPNAVVWRWLS